jgi:hypothetical protein
MSRQPSAQPQPSESLAAVPNSERPNSDAFGPLIDQLAEQVVRRATEMLGQQPPPTEARWLRGAKAIASHIGAPVSRVYDLSSAGRIPVEHDGSMLLAHTADLDNWIRSGGGIVP